MCAVMRWRPPITREFTKFATACTSGADAGEGPR
jgi:hypothetical protein